MLKNNVNLGSSFAKFAKEVLNPEGVTAQGQTERDRQLMSKIIMDGDFQAEYIGSYSYFFPSSRDSQSIIINRLKAMMNKYGMSIDFITNKS